MAALVALSKNNIENVLFILPLVLVGWYIISSILAWHRLRHIPGPFLATFSYAWLGRKAFTGVLDTTFRELGEQYGKLVRVGPNELITSDADYIRAMGSSKTAYLKGEWHDGQRFNPYHPTMFTTRDGAKHDDLKARVTPGYGGRDVPGYEAVVDEQVNSLTGLIRRRYVSAPEAGVFRDFALTRLLMYFPLDVIFGLSVGKHTGGEAGCLERDEEPYGFYSTLEEHLPQMTLTTDVPWIRRVLLSNAFLRWFGPKETDEKGMGTLMKFTNSIIRQRFAEREAGIEKQHKDALASFMSHGLSQLECEVEILFMFIAGSDTTAAAMKITMLHILSTPRVYGRLKAEISTALRAGRASSPITIAEARELPYLQAVIYEGLRIRPVTMAALAKQVPPGGDTVDGVFIPGGTSIGTNGSALLRDRDMFGPDADVFRPERFLGIAEADLVELRRNVELTFGYGRWMCAGKPIALMELNKVYFELFRYFDFQLLDPVQPMISEGYALFRDRGLRVRATEATDME